MVIKTKDPGYVYIFYNKLFKHYGDNVYKLGTTVNIKQRFGILNTSFLELSEFKFISYKFPCKYTAENELFKLLSEYRINKHKEFFDVELDVIIKAIQSLEIDNGLKDERIIYNHKGIGSVSDVVLFKKPNKVTNHKVTLIESGEEVPVYYGRDSYHANRFMNSKKYKYALTTGKWKFKE